MLNLTKSLFFLFNQKLCKMFKIRVALWCGQGLRSVEFILLKC